MVEEGLHVDAEGFVVAVDAGPVGGFAAHPGASDAGEDGYDDVVAQCQQGGDGTGCWGGDLVAPGPDGFDETVKPVGAAVRASTAVRAARIRGLFRSIPPTRVAPIWEGSGR